MRVSLAGLVLFGAFVVAGCGGGGGGNGSGGQDEDSGPSDLRSHQVSTSASTGGSISPGSRTVDGGASAIFAVTAGPGYVIDTVHGCGGTLDATLFTTAPVTAACTVTAEFRQDDRPIQLSAPVVEGALLPGSPANLSPGVRYSGDGFLEFLLVESPPGMTVNARSGHLRWTPTDEHAGQAFTVQLSATDGETSSSVTFSLRVAQPAVVSTASETLDDGRTRITVTDTDLALDGLEVFLPKDFVASDYVTAVRSGVPGITLIDSSDAPSVDFFLPDTAIPLTEFFRIDPVSAETDFIAILFPELDLPDGRHPEELILYVYEQPVRTAGTSPTWVPVRHALEVTEDNRAFVLVATTRDTMVVGLSPVSSVGDESTPTVVEYPLATPIAGSATVPIECESESRRIDRQLCTVEFPEVNGVCSLDGLTNCTARIRIRDFSRNAWTDPPDGFTVHDVAGWAADALVKFDTFGLPFDAWSRFHMTDPAWLRPADQLSRHKANIEVNIEADCSSRAPAGYVHPADAYRTLYINSYEGCASNMSFVDAKSTLVHEYFHHAQARAGNVIDDQVRLWLYEGTAVWFQDEVYDHHDYYLGFGIPRILDRGLTRPTQPIDTLTLPFGEPVPADIRLWWGYDGSPFFKLLQRGGAGGYGCDFEATNSEGRTFLAEIFSGHSSGQDGGRRLVEVIDRGDPFVDNSSFDCNFGSTFGATNRMANALEFYTYATQIKQDIRLLDSNEPAGSPTAWKRTKDVDMDFALGDYVHLPRLSSIVTRLNDPHSPLAKRTLEISGQQLRGTGFFVSLRNEQGELKEYRFVRDDVIQIVGTGSWDGWFMTLVNAEPEQTNLALVYLFAVESEPQVSIDPMSGESCTDYGLCGLEIVFGPDTDFSDTYVEIDWGNGASLSWVSVQDCIASGVCREQGDGRVRVWGSYTDPGSFSASLRYAFGEGAWQTVPAEFSVTAVNALPLDATPGDHSVTLDWPALPADEYNLCRSETSVSHLDNCHSEGGEHVERDIGMPPHLVSGLANAQEYFFRIEGRFGDRRIYSNEATATPTGAGVGLPGTHPLNDTGIDWCADGDTNFLDCPVAGYPGQDGEFGRDAAARAGTLQKVGAGDAGFDYTKISNSGAELPASATLGSGPNDWACTRDNVTGLIWEVKTTDGGLRDRNNTYTWYQPDGPNGGNPGTENGGSCVGSACDTTGFVQAVNAQGLCGATDWRLPTVGELHPIVHHGRTSPAVDTSFFSNTPSSDFWSASPYAGRSDGAWRVSFHAGGDYWGLKNGSLRVRLVRGGQ